MCPHKLLCTELTINLIIVILPNFNSIEFAKFCETYQIKRQLLVAYTPQQNGVCEQKNHVILNMVRSLLMSAIPKTFWSKAANWNIHVLKGSPTLSIQNDTGGSMDQTETDSRSFQIFWMCCLCPYSKPKKDKAR